MVAKVVKKSIPEDKNKNKSIVNEKYYLPLCKFEILNR
jgi:hypothetical protein